MKKLKTVIIVFLSCFIIVISMDFLFALKTQLSRINYLNSLYTEEGYNKITLKELPLNYSFRIYQFKNLFKRQIKRKEIKIYGEKTNKKPSILLFGCSFADGSYLDDEEQFGYLLSKYTNRNVIRLAYIGMGAAPALYIAQNDELYKYVEENSQPPEYAVYVYITNHQGRIYEDKYCFNDFNHAQIVYNQENGKLVYSNGNFATSLSRFAFGKYLLHKYFDENISSNTEYLNSLLKKYFIQIREELQKRYPNIKFVIVKYPTVYNDNEDLYSSKIWEELQKEGFIIYDLRKEMDINLTDKEYIVPDTHPNAKAWQLITPKFVKDIHI